jgi:hypothetical protein
VLGWPTHDALPALHQNMAACKATLRNVKKNLFGIPGIFEIGAK